MLKQRVLTALVLVAVLLIALTNGNPIYWQGFVSLVVFLGFYEWLGFCGIEAVGAKTMMMLAFVVLLCILYLGLAPMNLVIIALCFLWGLLFTFTLSKNLEVLHRKWIKVLIGALILAGSGWLIIEFKNIANGAWWILCFLVSVWAADIGAYFVGKRFGKTKLAPSISPGKTIEGLFGGLLLVVLVLTPVLFSLFSGYVAALLLLSVILTALASVIGDLFESKMKRHVGLKDSSQILPGHGGILDRIDSLLSGAPFFSAGLLVLGYLS